MTRTLLKRLLLFPLLVLGVVVAMTGTAFAYVTTDQSDYAPGSTVTISGDNSDSAGWLPGETVAVTVSGPNNYSATASATVDGAGAWSTQVVLWSDESAVGSYAYTAVGQTSGVTQSGTFEDGTYSVSDDYYNVVENVPVALPVAGSWPSVLTNDSLGVCVGGVSCKATLNSAPSHGAVSLDNTGMFLYVPAPGYVGPDAFTYTGTYYAGVFSGWKTAGTATVHITVVSNQVTDDSYTAIQGQTLVQPAPGLLGNDGLPQLGIVQTRAVQTSAAQHGAVAVNSDGSFSYTPAAGYVGTDSFGYQMQWSVAALVWYDGGSGTVTVTTIDTTPPMLTLPSDMTAEATSASGAVVTFSATATDAVDGPVVVTCTPASGSTFPLGSTTVNCGAVDNASNSASGSFQVKVVDTTAPVLTPPLDMTVWATSASGAVVTFSATATDAVDGPVAVACAPASGSTFALGSTIVSCSAADAAGNHATVNFKVSVVASWSGILQPVNSDGSSIFKSGSTVPIKFALTGDAAGIANLTARFFYAKVSNGILGDEFEALSTCAATTGNLFRYDATSGQYVFNWSTKGLSSGTYQVRIDLGDGAMHTVLISLK